MGITAQGDDLAPQTAVEPQDIGAGQRLVSTVGVALDAQPLGDDGTEDLLHLIHVVGEGHVLTVVFVDIPQGQGQVAQHLKLAPPGQRQHVLQIAVDDTIIIRFVGFFNIIKIFVVKFLSRHVDGADDKVQRRGILHQMLRPLKAHGGLSQLRSQPQGNAVAPLLLRLTELAADGVPIEVPAGLLLRAPVDGVHVIRQAQLIQPGGHGGLCRLCHGLPAVLRAGGMYVIICQIHRRYFFLKKLRCFS